MNIVEITTDSLDEMIENNELLVIDFWVEWCAPCQSFTKVLERIAPQYPEFVFGSVNIDREKELMEEFDIQSIPAMMIIRNRVVVFAESGALTAGALSELLDQTKALDPEQLNEDGIS